MVKGFWGKLSSIYKECQLNNLMVFDLWAKKFSEGVFLGLRILIGGYVILIYIYLYYS